MTGPEHYAEAERLLAIGAGNRGSDMDVICTRAAQVHAALALAAVQAMSGDLPAPDWDAWREMAQTKQVEP